MSRLLFSPLTIEQKALYERFYFLSKNKISDVNFVSRIAWNKAFCYEYAEVLGTLVLLSKKCKFSTSHLAVPLGVTDASHMEQVIDCLFDEWSIECSKHQAGKPYLRFLYVEKEKLNQFQYLKKYDAEVLMKPKYSDYVYKKTDLATLKGKFYNGKRNHINKFYRNYPNCTFDLLKVTDKEECLHLVKEWSKDKTVDFEDLVQSDYYPIKTLFDHFEALNLTGGILRYNHRVIAFSIVSNAQPNTAIVHIEKASPDFKGAYAVINQLTAKEACLDVEWINREEDLGIDGLRQAKLSYGPSFMIDKYEVFITKKE